ELGNLDEPGGVENMLDRLSQDDGALARELFGESVPEPVERLIASHRGGASASEAEARSILERALEEKPVPERYRDYFSSVDEHEAYVVGRRARIAMEQGGAGPGGTAGGGGDLPPSSVPHEPVASARADGTAETIPPPPPAGDIALTETIPPPPPARD